MKIIARCNKTLAFLRDQDSAYESHWRASQSVDFDSSLAQDLRVCLSKKFPAGSHCWGPQTTLSTAKLYNVSHRI